MKRGISPLIATVLITGFAVALAAVIMIWGSGFIKGLSGSTEEKAEVNLLCSKVNLNLKRTCIYGEAVESLIENVGSDVAGLTFRIRGSQKVYTDTETGKAGLNSGAIQNHLVWFDTETLGEPQKIQIAPSVSYKGNKYSCAALEEKEIFPCYRLSIITETLEGWKVTPFSPTNGLVKVFDLEALPTSVLEANDIQELAQALEIEIDPNQLNEIKGEEIETLRELLNYSKPPIQTASKYVLFLLPVGNNLFNVILQSPSFTIPEEVNSVHFRSYLNIGAKSDYDIKIVSTGVAEQSLKVEPQPPAYDLPEIIDLPVTIDPNLKGKTAYLSVTLNGYEGDYITVSEICFTKDPLEKCVV